MATVSQHRILHRARASDLPRPTNVDAAFRRHEGDGALDPYYGRQSSQDSVGMAALCFCALIGFGVIAAVYEFLRRLIA